jgi:hypothetical protein
MHASLIAVQAVAELQRRMPDARVLYVSATGATESTNLGYMSRLGLWGPGTAFRSRQEFVGLLQQRGVGARRPPRRPDLLPCTLRCIALLD